MGVFDQESIKVEVDKLRQFMTSWQQDHHQPNKEYVFLGYSNGANMILATLFYFPDLVSAAVLLHPMLPFNPSTISLTGKRLFISHGDHDPMVTKQQQTTLTELLKEKGASITEKTYAGGHEISREEIRDVVAFLG